jgi:hypothetical protein
VYRVDDAAAGGTPEERVLELAEAARSVARVIAEHHAEHRHLIAHGRRWSFGGVVRCQDGVLETHGALGQVIDATREVGGQRSGGLLHRALSPAARAREHVYVEAGVEMQALMRALDARGLALTTAGSSSGQSLAGIVNTSSHGCDFDIPPIADGLRAVAIVGPDETVRWVEPASGLTRDGGHAELLPGSVLVRDDDAFDAALVTVGALGVVVAYVLEVRETYGIWETVERLDWPTVRPMIAHGGAIFDRPAVWSGAPLDPAATYRGLEVLINPFPDPTTRRRNVHVVRRAERASVTPGLERWERAGFLEQVRNALLGVWTLIQTASEDLDDYGPAVDRLLATGREDTGGFAPAHRVLDFGNERIERPWSVDVVLPTTGDVHLRFLDEVLSRFDGLMAANLKLAGFFALRFSRASRASLAMQHAPSADPDLRFAQLELFLLQSPFDPVHLDLWREWELVQDGERFYEAFCEVAEQYRRAGQLRVHWGQMMPALRSFAPDAASLARWRRGRDQLVGARPYLFANPMMLATGVVEAPAGFTLDGILPESEGDVLDRAHHLALVGTGPAAGPDGTLYAVDAQGSASRRAGAGRWKALHPGRSIDDDRCPAGPLLVGVRAAGGRCIVARDARARLRASREEGPDRWSDWRRVGSERVEEPALVSTTLGLEILAVSERGLERYREEGDDGWEHVTTVRGSEDLVGAVAVAALAAGPLVLGRRADGGLVASSLAAGGWMALGQSTPREPALLSVGPGAIAVWLGADDRLAACELAADGAAASAVARAPSACGLAGGGRIHVAPRAGGSVRVAIADSDRRVRVLEIDRHPALAWREAEGPFDFDALGTPLIVGDTLFAKVAHDLVVRRAL